MMRGSVIFDESGFLSTEMMNVYGAFAIVNKSFGTGFDEKGNELDPIRMRTFANNLPNQKFYISSASDTSTEFYRLYREFSKKQLMGDPDYCVIHVDCEVAFAPTVHGEVVAPLLSKSTVATELRTNPEKARREYYCQFTTDAGANSIIRRGVITRNEEIRKPLLCNDTGDKKFVLLYDPARSKDNSVVLVAEIYYDSVDEKNPEYKMKLVNCINLVDIGKKRKTPMQTPDQIKYLKELILDYNIGGDDSYSNILGIYIDAGTGGAGVNIADFLMEDWVGKDGKKHRGLIDKEYSADYVKKFPNAVDKIHLLEPTKYKSEMYEALIELIHQDKISFTAQYDNKGYLMMMDVDQDKYNKAKQEIINKLKKEKLSDEEFGTRLDEELLTVQNVKTKMVKLDWQEEIGLSTIDALKEELVNMVRKEKTTNKDSFELCPEKQNTMHDDKAYVTAMAAYALQCYRRKHITNKQRPKAGNLVQRLPIKQAKRTSMFG